MSGCNVTAFEASLDSLAPELCIVGIAGLVAVGIRMRTPTHSDGCLMRNRWKSVQKLFEIDFPEVLDASNEI